MRKGQPAAPGAPTKVVAIPRPATESTLSARGRRHARNIERSAKRRMNERPCYPGTDTVVAPVKDRELAIRMVHGRAVQDARITAKREQRQAFAKLDKALKIEHRVCGEAHHTPRDILAGR